MLDTSDDTPDPGRGSRAGDELIALAKAGDNDALGRLCDIYRDYLVRIASNELGGGLQAKVASSDIAQEVLLNFRQTVAKLRGTSEPELRRYLRQIVLNRVAFEGRKYYNAAMRDVQREVPLNGHHNDNARADAIQIVDFSLTPLAQLVCNEENALVRQALQTLPEHYRQVIELRDLAGKSWTEVGDAMQRSADSVRQLWYRAMGALRESWERLHGEPGSP